MILKYRNNIIHLNIFILPNSNNCIRFQVVTVSEKVSAIHFFLPHELWRALMTDVEGHVVVVCDKTSDMHADSLDNSVSSSRTYLQCDPTCRWHRLPFISSKSVYTDPLVLRSIVVILHCWFLDMGQYHFDSYSKKFPIMSKDTNLNVSD